MNQTLKIHHDLADVIVRPCQDIHASRLRKMIRSTLDAYLEEETVPAQLLHEETAARHGATYMSPGYHLRLYRLRADLTQAALAQQAGIRQHHLSEMENNKRPIGKVMAQKLAGLLNCDWRRLL